MELRKGFKIVFDLSQLHRVSLSRTVWFAAQFAWMWNANFNVNRLSNGSNCNLHCFRAEMPPEALWPGPSKWGLGSAGPNCNDCIKPAKEMPEHRIKTHCYCCWLCGCAIVWVHDCECVCVCVCGKGSKVIPLRIAAFLDYLIKCMPLE